MAGGLMYWTLRQLHLLTAARPSGLSPMQFMARQCQASTHGLGDSDHRDSKLCLLSNASMRICAYFVSFAGICLFVITAGALPFDEPNLGMLFKKIQKADYQTPAWFSRDLAHLLHAIITPDPKDR